MAVQIGPTAPAEYFSQKIRPILADWHRSVSPGPDQEMEALARRGLAWNPRHPDLYFAMAQAQSAMGDLATDPAAQAAYYRQAVESYQNALRYAPGNVFIVISCAVTLDSAQRFLEAEPLYQRAIALDPLGKAVHVPYGNHLVMMGKFDEAAAEFRFAADHWATQGALAGFRFIEEEKERLRKEAEGKAASPEKPAEK